MLKNIQKYDILHSIIDDCRQKILKLAERPQGDMNMFKKVGLGFLFVGLAFGVMALCEITRGVGADASVKASVLWPVFIGRKDVLLFAQKKRSTSLCRNIELRKNEMKITKKEFIMMLGGMFLMSAAVYYEMMPNNLVLGSLSGLVLVLVKIIPLPVSTITFVLNMILLVIGYIFIGREFGVKTVLASLMLPMYLRIFEILTPHVESLSGNIVIDLVCFMIVVGAGQAVLFNMNASSGGIDIVAKLINKYLGFKIGQSITIIGVLISMAAIFVYDRETMVISLVGTLIYGQVLDRFCDGFHVRKKVSILSKEHEKIQNYIVKELRRGATIYPAYGGLDHAEHVEVVTILEKNEYGKLLSFIHETDEHAFVTVSTVNEVVGAWNTVKSR